MDIETFRADGSLSTYFTIFFLINKCSMILVKIFIVGEYNISLIHDKFETTIFLNEF